MLVDTIGMMIQVVDAEGQTIGEIEKIAAHQDGGVWHRAISVFLFDVQGRLLLQRRAATKYHFAGLWANSCCSHPEVGELPLDAALRTIGVELGITPQVEEISQITYEAFDARSGLTEKEFDHIFAGNWNEGLVPNPEEVNGVRWVSAQDLSQEMKDSPERFVPWLSEILRGLKAQDFARPEVLVNFLERY